MKTHINNLLWIGFALSVFISCQEDESIDKISKTETDLPVIHLVKNYETNARAYESNSLQGVTKSQESEIEIRDYEKTTYTFFIDKTNRANTNSIVEDEIPNSTTVDVYLVNFEKEGVPGWSIATADERISKVYAYTEAGHIADTAIIPPLAEIIENIPRVVERDINKFYNDPKTKATGTYISIGPLLKTSWAQWSPYNRDVPLICSANSSGKAPLGCVATAAAQTIAYYNKFKPTYYGNDNLNLTTLASMAFPNTIALQNQASTFCHEVAIYCQIRFGCDGSGSQIHDAAQYMGEMGYKYEFENNASIPQVNPYKAYQCFSRGDIVMTGGNKASGSGHAWLYDGIRGYLNGTSFEVETFHCNWGQGYPEGNTAWCNGWYVNYREPVPGGNDPYTSYNDNVYFHVK